MNVPGEIQLTGLRSCSFNQRKESVFPSSYGTRPGNFINVNLIETFPLYTRTEFPDTAADRYLIPIRGKTRLDNLCVYFLILAGAGIEVSTTIDVVFGIDRRVSRLVNFSSHIHECKQTRWESGNRRSGRERKQSVFMCFNLRRAKNAIKSKYVPNKMMRRRCAAFQPNTN